ISMGQEVVPSHRCLKSHRLGTGHNPGERSQDLDACGICRGEHRVSECEITGPGQFRYVTCKAGAWRLEQEMPAFIAYNQKFQIMYPENLYRYYPARDDLES
ncbi:hypothetical protein BU17DRAFT_52633, partial [Hysterangium stoloniferum]